MSLSEGEKLGPYEVVALIGKGGMGEVHRARDPRLGRDVAIKVSAERFTERFDREARVIASLNHSHICHLYDVGPNYLVMELVEGPTLADRIKEGPIPFDEAMEIARQIVDALEAAHEKGVTHRDLKPANIKITPDGNVKVLDFGLAKVGGKSHVDTDNSPTRTVDQTEAGIVLGTAAYMSPEQARGKAVDQRADIYAFGVILYEMLVGERLHNGETTTEVLASVLKEEPRWDRVPTQVQRLLRRCLEKDPSKRQRHIGDVMALVDEVPLAPAPAPVSVQPKHKLKWVWYGGAAALAIAIGVVLWALWRSESNIRSIRFEIHPTDKAAFILGGAPALSPDGRWVVFPAKGKDNVMRMWLRALDSVELTPLAGTEAGNALPPPVFWSPDSRFIAFSVTPGPFAPGQLKKLAISGGPPQKICDIPSTAVGGTWSRDGVIIFAPNSGGLMRVSAGGGEPVALTTLNSAAGERFHLWPQFLPDGRHFLYLRVSNIAGSTATFVGSIDAKPEEQSTKPLLVGDQQMVYSTAGGIGRLLFVRDTTLFAQPFDAQRLELKGDAVPVADQVGFFQLANAGLFSVSETGVLAYRVGAGAGALRQLTWYDSEGKPAGTMGDKGLYTNPALSPDATHVAVTQLDQQSGSSNIWVIDVSRGTSTKVTFNAGRNDFPVWSPDGKSVVFAS